VLEAGAAEREKFAVTRTKLASEGTPAEFTMKSR